MAGVLIRMKLTILRRAYAGPQASYVQTGAVLGAAAAIATIALATLDAEPATLRDLLAVVFALWTLGWALAPAYGGAPVLRPEHFALQPIPRHRLAFALLGAAFVGIAAAITLVAFGALIVLGARLGTVPALLAIPGTALQLALVVVLSRLAARGFGALSRSRVGGAVSALITGVMLVAASSGWIVFVALDAVLDSGFSDGFSTALTVLPSSWAVLAVEASSPWPLLGLAALVALLVLAWTRALGPPRLARTVVRGSAHDRGGSVFRKELRSWWRDPVRLQSVIVAPVFAVLTCLVPLAFDSTEFLPFIGALIALMGAVMSANAYGQDGTALWLTILTPGSERADVRGRQLAWLAVFGPMTVIGAAISPSAYGIAAAAALLGAGAGLVPLVSVTQLVPGPDPREHRDSPLEHGDLTGQAFLMLILAATAAAPAVGVVALAGVAGIGVGLVTGVLGALLLGRAAEQRLRERGPELLQLMRSGKPPANESAPTPARIWLFVTLGMIALFPQAIVPAVMKLTGEVARVWFLALYVPGAWQWPTIVFMALLGIGALTLAGRTAAAAGAAR